MNDDTRSRLLRAAATLFAESGERGASVRDICNLAGANPGAVSYHFGGKRQLYRAVLRRAAERLSAPLGEADASPADLARHLLRRLRVDTESTRLLLRDIASGGQIASEVLEPTLRLAVEELRARVGLGDSPADTVRVRTLFLRLAAPVLTLAAVGPLLAPALDLDPSDPESTLDRILEGLAVEA